MHSIQRSRIAAIVITAILAGCSASLQSIAPGTPPSDPAIRVESPVAASLVPTPAPTALAPSYGPTASPTPSPTPALPTYRIEAVAGDASGSAGNIGNGGPATLAEFHSPAGLALSSGGDLYIADYGNHEIRVVSANGITSSFAGIGAFGFAGDGGPAIDAQFNHPWGVAMIPGGGVAIADYGNNRVRVVNSQGTVETLAGGGANPPVSGASATASALAGPTGIAYDTSGHLYVAEFAGARVDRIDPTGQLTIVAGTGATGSVGDGGPAKASALNEPIAVLPDSKGDLYIADFGNQRVQMIDPQGIIHTIAGTGTAGSIGDGGPATSAELDGPAALALLPDGTLVIADSGNAEIRAVSPDGTIRTVAGTGATGNAGDGGPALSALLSDPLGLVASGSSTIVSDFGNNRIRALNPG